MEGPPRGDLAANQTAEALMIAACQYARLGVIEYLLAQGGNFEKHSIYLMRRAIVLDQIEPLEWMRTAGFSGLLNMDQIFHQACRYGKLKVAQWAVQNGAEIYRDNCRSFRMACLGLVSRIDDDTQAYLVEADRIRVVEWLLTLQFPDEVVQNAVEATADQEPICDLLLLYIRGKRTKGANTLAN